MENNDLKDIISNVKQPTFDDDMIKRLAEMFINSKKESGKSVLAGKSESREMKKSKFYNAVQNANEITYSKNLDDTMLKKIVGIAKECNNNDFLSNIIDKIKLYDLEDKIHVDKGYIKELQDASRIDVSTIGEEEIKKMFRTKDDRDRINRKEEKELRNKKNVTWNQNGMFNHMGGPSDIDYCISRLYVNCEKQDLMKIANLFTDKCNSKEIPSYFKYVSNNSTRSDQIVIYSNLKELKNYIQILQEIGEQNPDIIKRCGKPPLLVGRVNEWIGIGDEPREKKESYTTLRSSIIYDVLERNIPTESDEISMDVYTTENLDYTKIREELKEAFKGINIDIDTFAFNNENLQLYMSDDKIISNYDMKKKQFIQQNRNKIKTKTKEEMHLEERVAINELKLLNKLGDMPEIIGSMVNAVRNRNNFFSDIYIEDRNTPKKIIERLGLDNNIIISDKFEIKRTTEDGVIDLTDNQREEIISRVMNDVTNYYVEYVDNMMPLMDNILNQYTELLDKEDYESKETLVDLDSTLRVLSNGKNFFEAIGISDEKIESTCDKADSFLKEIDKQTEEKFRYEGEKTKSKIDREFLSIFFEESGITDKEELRKLYESWENFEVSSEDLEAVLSAYDDNNYTEKEIKMEDNVTSNFKNEVSDNITTDTKLVSIGGATVGMMVGKINSALGAKAGIKPNKRISKEKIGKATINASTDSKNKARQVEEIEKDKGENERNDN